nr:MAG TPA: hypothetical protein [Bacteriophage sp.]
MFAIFPLPPIVVVCPPQPRRVLFHSRESSLFLFFLR